MAPLPENLGAFFLDFGVLVQFAGGQFYGNFDEPDQAILGDRVLSTQYVLTCSAKDGAGFSHGTPLVADGVDYTVVEKRRIDDGALLHVLLQRANTT